MHFFALTFDLFLWVMGEGRTVAKVVLKVNGRKQGLHSNIFR